MSKRIGQPVTQVRLTNVAIVKFKKKGKRFEIACYRNKIVNWRNRVETDISEVLQIDRVFTNVSKGKVANAKDLIDVFGTDDHEAVSKIILEQGELQVSDKERQTAQESIYRDIATIVAEKTVNPESNRPYPVGLIERAMKDIHFAPVQNRSAKQQALEVIKTLMGHMPIARAKMQLAVELPAEHPGCERIKQQLAEQNADIRHQSSGGLLRIVFLVDPGSYRKVEEIVRSESGGQGKLDILEFSVQREGEDDVDSELLRKERKAKKLERDDGNGSPSVVTEETAGKTLSTSSSASPTKRSPTIAPKVARGGLTCTTCGGRFGDKNEHREHFRSQWHRYNLKLKLKGLPLVDEESFSQISQDEIEDFLTGGAV